jgi:hypothetical protein
MCDPLHTYIIRETREPRDDSSIDTTPKYCELSVQFFLTAEIIRLYPVDETVNLKRETLLLCDAV